MSQEITDTKQAKTASEASNEELQSSLVEKTPEKVNELERERVITTVEKQYLNSEERSGDQGSSIRYSPDQTLNQLNSS